MKTKTVSPELLDKNGASFAHAASLNGHDWLRRRAGGHRSCHRWRRLARATEAII
jgi:hypothetical protein